MKRHYKTILWIVVGVWTAAILALLVPMLLSAHREGTVVVNEFSEYGSSLVGQRFDQAYQYCGADFRRAMTYEQFVKLYKDLEQQNGSLKAVTRQSYEVHGSGTPMHWSAVIDADFVYQKKTLRFRFVFHKDDNRWSIFGFEQS